MSVFLFIRRKSSPPFICQKTKAGSWGKAGEKKGVLVKMDASFNGLQTEGQRRLRDAENMERMH